MKDASHVFDWSKGWKHEGSEYQSQGKRKGERLRRLCMIQFIGLSQPTENLGSSCSWWRRPAHQVPRIHWERFMHVSLTSLSRFPCTVTGDLQGKVTPWQCIPSLYMSYKCELNAKYTGIQNQPELLSQFFLQTLAHWALDLSASQSHCLGEEESELWRWQYSHLPRRFSASDLSGSQTSASFHLFGVGQRLMN